MFISGKLPTLDIDEYEYEKNIFLNVIKYCEKFFKTFFQRKKWFYDFKFNINSQSSHKDREIFFKNYFGNENWAFVPWDLYKNSISYRKKFDKNVLVIFTDSTLGYEFLSRGYKCVSFTNNFPIYGQHHNFNRKGLFWSDTSNFKEMTALIDSVKLIKNSDWKKNYKKYSEQILPYDEENRFKKSIIKSFLK